MISSPFCAVSVLNVCESQHSRPHSTRSFWPAAGIESSGPTRFSEDVQSNRFIFSANQICQIWREVRESRTSGVGQNQSSRSLPEVGRIVALGTRMEPHTKECQSMLFVKKYVPYLRDLSNSFSNSFIDFYSCEVVSWSNMRKNEVLSFDRFASIMAVVFKLWIYFM